MDIMDFIDDENRISHNISIGKEIIFGNSFLGIHSTRKRLGKSETTGTNTNVCLSNS